MKNSAFHGRRRALTLHAALGDLAGFLLPDRLPAASKVSTHALGIIARTQKGLFWQQMKSYIVVLV
ncbi:MAG: hypothetical protein AAF320_06140 [Myxococcota bacterium]